MAVFADSKLVKGQVSRTAAQRSYSAIKTQVARWLEQYQPQDFVIEDYRTATRKAPRQRRTLRHLPALAHRCPCRVRIVSRQQTHQNKFDEAAALARRFRSLRDRVPQKPKLWEAEPHFVSLFEAVALGASVLDEAKPKTTDHAT